MQHITCVQWTMDNKYVLSGSDEMCLRLWKAKASEKLGVVRWTTKFVVKEISPPSFLDTKSWSWNVGIQRSFEREIRSFPQDQTYRHTTSPAETRLSCETRAQDDPWRSETSRSKCSSEQQTWFCAICCGTCQTCFERRRIIRVFCLFERINITPRAILIVAFVLDRFSSLFRNNLRAKTSYWKWSVCSPTNITIDDVLDGLLENSNPMRIGVVYQLSAYIDIFLRRETHRIAQSYKYETSFLTNSMATLCNLPVELVYRILNHLRLFDVRMSARNVCDRLNQIIDTYQPYQVTVSISIVTKPRCKMFKL